MARQLDSSLVIRSSGEGLGCELENLMTRCQALVITMALLMIVTTEAGGQVSISTLRTSAETS